MMAYIQQLEPAQLLDIRLMALGAQFYQEAHLPGKFLPAVFRKNWEGILRMNFGVIFLAWRDDHLVGAIGMVMHPDVCDDALVAQEMFWFIDPKERNGRVAIQLFDRAQEWAKERNAARIAMASVLGPHAPSLRRFYMKRGFTPVDVSYFKNL